jgi:predicted esterase
MAMPDPVILSPAAPPRLLCVLVHGRNQTPDDLAPLVVAARAAGARIAMPVAEGKSWYDARAVEPLTPQTEAQLAASLAVLHRCILAVHDPALPVLLAGFSQGACLVAEYLMRVGSADGACILTGARVGTTDDSLPVRAQPGVPVYLSGSDADPWIPIGSFEALGKDLHRAGARLRCDMLPGRKHEISVAEAAAFAEMAGALAAGRRPFGDAA